MLFPELINPISNSSAQALVSEAATPPPQEVWEVPFKRMSEFGVNDPLPPLPDPSSCEIGYLFSGWIWGKNCGWQVNDVVGWRESNYEVTASWLDITLFAKRIGNRNGPEPTPEPMDWNGPWEKGYRHNDDDAGATLDSLGHWNRNNPSFPCVKDDLVIQNSRPYIQTGGFNELGCELKPIASRRDNGQSPLNR